MHSRPIPRDVATCPECDGDLHVIVKQRKRGTDEPLSGEVSVACVNTAGWNGKGEDDPEHRRPRESWRVVVLDIERWLGAVDG